MPVPNQRGFTGKRELNLKRCTFARAFALRGNRPFMHLNQHFTDRETQAKAAKLMCA